MQDDNDKIEPSRPLERVEESHDGYDPYAHRKPEKPTSNTETLIHLIKSCFGTGVLAMPQAFHNAGFYVGIVLTIVCGMITAHCFNILFRTQYIICKRRQVPYLTYSESMTIALQDGPKCLRPFAKCCGMLATFYIICSQLGICCCYIVFISNTMKTLIDPVRVMRIEIHMCIVMGPLLLANLITSLKALTPFSILANILCLLTVLATMVLLLIEDPVSKEPIQAIGSLETLPLYFGTMVFAYAAVGAVISLEKNMRTPKALSTGWFGVFNISMIIVILTYLFLGCIGYLFCKSKCQANISLNLPATILMKIMWAAYAVSILISYVLHFFSPIGIFWDLFFEERLEDATGGKKRCNLYALRMGLCIFTFALALMIPNLTLIISLTGALCMATIALMFPALMELCVQKNNYGRCNYILWKDIFLFTYGFLGMVVGSGTAIKDIILGFRAP